MQHFLWDVHVWSVNYFDGVYVARAGVCSGGASASGGAVALLWGARKFCSCGLADGELKQWGTNKRVFFSFTWLITRCNISVTVVEHTDTCVTGWWRSTITELMGGATPITWRLLRAVLPTSERAAMRAVTVLEGFCWLAVMTRPLTWKQQILQRYIYMRLL